jgi:hypothetical protein
VSAGMPLVINIGFRFERPPMFKRLSKDAKSTKSSSKSSSTEGDSRRFSRGQLEFALSRASFSKA